MGGEGLGQALIEGFKLYVDDDAADLVAGDVGGQAVGSRRGTSFDKLRIGATLQQRSYGPVLFKTAASTPTRPLGTF